MAIIGTLTRTANGFAGTIKTLTLDVPVTLRPTEKDSDKAPDDLMAKVDDVLYYTNDVSQPDS